VTSLQRGSRAILVGAGRFAEEITDIAIDAGVEIVAWIEGLGIPQPALAGLRRA
jgi:hypothetical protein